MRDDYLQMMSSSQVYLENFLNKVLYEFLNFLSHVEDTGKDESLYSKDVVVVFSRPILLL